MKIPCNIVQDLLPNYIEELCSEETCEQVGAHLQDCKECDAKYKEMKGELPEELRAERSEVSVEEIQPMKKIKKRHWQQVAVLAAVVLVLLGGALVLLFQKIQQKYNTLTIEVQAETTGELFREMEAAMLEKWKAGRSLRVLWKGESFVRAVRDMNLYLINEDMVYQVRTYYAYEEGAPVRVEIKRIKLTEDNVLFDKELSESVPWEDLVEAMEQVNYTLTPTNAVYLDIRYKTFSASEVSIIPVVAESMGHRDAFYVLGLDSLERIAASLNVIRDGSFYCMELREEQWEVDEETREVVNEARIENDKWVFIKIVE